MKLQNQSAVWSFLVRLRRSWVLVKGVFPYITWAQAQIIVAVLFISDLILTFEYLTPQPPFQGIPDNMAAAWLDVVIIFASWFSILFLWTAWRNRERERIWPTVETALISEKFIVELPIDYRITLSVEGGTWKQCRPSFVVESMLKWTEFDKDSYFRLDAGSLDIPKIAVRSIARDDRAREITLSIGMASFFDIYFTHHSPDLIISTTPSDEGRNNPKHTLRKRIGAQIETFYQHQTAEWKKGEPVLSCSNLLPNPLGLSGIAIVPHGDRNYVILRRRSLHQIADRDKLEWSFAGLADATSWQDGNRITLEEFVADELRDELYRPVQLPCLKKFQNDVLPKIYPIGLAFNKLLLFQPELFIVALFNSVNDLQFEELTLTAKRNDFLIIECAELRAQIEKHRPQCKNLVWPGLILLERHRLIET